MKKNELKQFFWHALRMFFLPFVLLGISSLSMSQTLTVSGTVTSASGEALIGVSVVVKGEGTGTVTNFNGNYSISVERAKTLEFSYVGYVTRSLVVNQPTLNVVLEEDAKMLSEVVAIGYGSMRRENLTGAVSTVDIGKALSSRPISDVSRGLQGTTPGLTVIVGNGEVGSEAVLKIRGQIGSLYGTSSPLILLDNVEIPSIQLVNPGDVESISVLKDASSTSIYGSKGAFGVILITSKKGSKKDGVRATYSTNYSWQNVAKDINMGGIDAVEYSVLAAERVNAAKAGAFFRVDRASFDRSKEWIQKYGNSVSANDPILYGRDWYMSGADKMGVRLYDPYTYMVREWAPAKNHNLSVSGGSEKTTYNIGLDYLNQQGMMKPAKKDQFTKYNASLRLSTEVNKYLTVRAGMLFSNRTKEYPYVTTGVDPWLYLYRWGPVQPLGTEDGEELRGPVGEAKSANTGKQAWSYNNVNVGATLNLTKDWTV